MVFQERSRARMCFLQREKKKEAKMKKMKKKLQNLSRNLCVRARSHTIYHTITHTHTHTHILHQQRNSQACRVQTKQVLPSLSLSHLFAMTNISIFISFFFILYVIIFLTSTHTKLLVAISLSYCYYFIMFGNIFFLILNKNFLAIVDQERYR